MFAARGLWTVILTLLISLFASCGGSTPAPTATPDSPAQTPEVSAGLPGMPGGPEELRDATMVTGAFQMGTEYIWRHNAPDVGTDLHLIAPEGPGDYTAWAYYAFPDTGTQPSTLTVNAMWLDPDLQGTSPDEGYWIGISDYDKGAWRFFGPTTLSQLRLWIPVSANVISPGGFIYAIVLTHSGDEAVLHSIQIGYDAGVGYEEYWLGAPQGMSTGQQSDIQLLNDNPQIAYISQRGLSDRGGTAKIATLLVDEWHTETIDTPFSVNSVRFALGDSGRRAALLDTRDVSPQELWFFYDDGSGAFDAGQMISNTFDNDCTPAVTFVNGADDPTGDLNLVLMVYADQGVAWQDMHTYYRTYDGVLLAPQLDMYGGDTTDTSSLALSTDSNLAGLCGVGNNAGGWRYYVGTFSALVPAWNFGAVVSWICPGNVPSEPDFVLSELPSGDYVAGYHTYDDTVILARWDAVAWNFETRDIHSVYLGDENDKILMDMEACSDGDVGIPGSYGMFSPVLHMGQVGIGSTDWDDFYLDTAISSYMRPSLAVGSDDKSHISYFSVGTFTLGYMTRAADGTVTNEIVDTGTMAPGMNGAYVSATMADNYLYVFSTDDAHMKLLYSINVNGMWPRENVVIPTPGSYPFYIVGSGYLENEDLVYVGWWDYVDLSVYIATAHPFDDDWEVVQFTMQALELWPTLADDESEIGIVYLTYSHALGEGVFAFGHGPARIPNAPWEVITLSGDYAYNPWTLAHNPIADEWGFLATDDNNHRANYFRRTAPDIWQGPTTILYREGTGEAYGFGLSFRESDGAAQALLAQKLDGTTVYYLSIFSAPSGTSNWSFVNTFASVDTTVGEIDEFLGRAPDENGEIVAFMSHRLLGDPYWDIEIYTTDGTDSWASTGLWDDAYSRIAESEGAESIFAGVVTQNGPAAFIVEADAAMPTFGRVGAWYPW